MARFWTMALGAFSPAIGASWTKFIFRAALVLCAGVASAAPPSVALSTPLRNLVLVSPQYPPLRGPLRPYAASGPDANWGVTDWSLPGGALPPFQPHGSALVAANSTATVTLQPNAAGPVVTISQDGSNLPCLAGNGGPRELDMFINPNPRNVRPPGVPGVVGNTPPLSDMRSLIVSTGVTLHMGLARVPKGCRANWGSAIISLILRDTAVQPSQTLFYQFVIGRICGNSVTVPLKSCSVQAKKPMIFSNRSTSFGNDDYLPLSGQAWVVSDKPRQLHIDLLPRLTLMIESRYGGGIDRNLADWHVGTFYIGQHIWGDTSLSSTWSNFNLTATLATP